MDGAMRTGLKILHIICFLLLLGSGDFQVRGLTVTGEDVPIEALRGDNVSIPCLLSGVPIPLNLQKLSVVWTQILLNGTEHEVYSFRSSHHQSLRPGSYMNDSDIKQGNASLYIPNIQITDEGEYLCFVIFTPDSGIGTSTLHVSVTPQATLSHIQMFESANLVIHVYCKVSKFYPEAVDIRWDKYSKMNGTNSTLDEDVSLTIPLRNSDGTFNVTSVLTVRPDTGTEPGDIIFCIVSHRSLKEEITLSFTMPRRNPVQYFYYTIYFLIILQVLSIPMRFILKKRWRPWIHAFFIVITILLLIFYRLVYYFIKDINGIPKKSRYDFMLSLDIMCSILVAFYGILFLKYFIKGYLLVSEISGDRHIPHMKRTTLTCQITNFRPKEIQINVYLKRRNQGKLLIASWESTDLTSSNNSPNDLSTSGGQEDNNSNILPLLEVEITKSCIGMYKCLCSISITLSADTDDGALLGVEVEHASRKWPISVYRTLNVYKDIPVVSDIVGDMWIPHMEKKTLSFQITEFKLKEIQINVYLKRQNDIKSHLIHSWMSVDCPLGEDNTTAEHQNGGAIEEDPLLNDTMLPVEMEDAVNNTMLPVEMEDAVNDTMLSVEMEDTVNDTMLPVKMEDTVNDTTLSVKMEDAVNNTMLPVEMEDAVNDTMLSVKMEDAVNDTMLPVKMEDAVNDTMLPVEMEDAVNDTMLPVKMEDAVNDTTLSVKMEDAVNDTTLSVKMEDAVNDTMLSVKMEVEMRKTENGSYKCDCRISLTPNADTDDGAILTVEVDHAALEWPRYRYQILNVIKGDKPSLWRRWSIPFCDAITIYDIL